MPDFLQNFFQMPLAQSAIPIAAHAAGITAVSATAPWWALTVLTLITGIALVYLTEWAKAKFARPRTESDLLVAQETINSNLRRDERELLNSMSANYNKINEQYTQILIEYRTVIVQNAENAATVKVQTSEIDHLRSDVKDLQVENASLKAKLENAQTLAHEISGLKERVSLLENQVKDKEREIVRLENLLHKEQARTTTNNC